MGMTFQEAIQLYRDIYHRFEKVEGKPWGVNGAMIELTLSFPGEAGPMAGAVPGVFTGIPFQGAAQVRAAPGRGGQEADQRLKTV